MNIEQLNTLMNTLTTQSIPNLRTLDFQITTDQLLQVLDDGTDLKDQLIQTIQWIDDFQMMEFITGAFTVTVIGTILKQAEKFEGKEMSTLLLIPPKLIEIEDRAIIKVMFLSQPIGKINSIVDELTKRFKPQVATTTDTNIGKLMSEAAQDFIDEHDIMEEDLLYEPITPEQMSSSINQYMTKKHSNSSSNKTSNTTLKGQMTESNQHQEIPISMQVNDSHPSTTTSNK